MAYRSARTVGGIFASHSCLWFLVEVEAVRNISKNNVQQEVWSVTIHIQRIFNVTILLLLVFYLRWRGSDRILFSLIIGARFLLSWWTVLVARFSYCTLLQFQFIIWWSKCVLYTLQSFVFWFFASLYWDSVLSMTFVSTNQWNLGIVKV